MNKAYKVIFSKLRGTMMAVNEVTKSHRVGKRAVVAVAIAGALGSYSVSALAANTSITEFDYTTGQMTVDGVTLTESPYIEFICGGSNTSPIEHSYEMSINGTLSSDFDWKTIVGASELSSLLDFDYPNPTATVNVGSTSVKIDAKATVAGMGVFGGSAVQSSRWFGFSSEEGAFDSPIQSINVNTKSTNVTFAESAAMNFLSGYEPVPIVTAGDLIIGADYGNPEVGSVRPSIEVKTNINQATLTLSSGDYGAAVLSGGSLVSTAQDGSIAINASASVDTSVINVTGNIKAAAIIGGGVAQDIIPNFIIYEGVPRLETHVGTSTINIGSSEANETSILTDVYAGGLNVFYRLEDPEEPEIASIEAIGKVTVGESTINVTNASVSGTIYGANAQGRLEENACGLVLNSTDQTVKTHLNLTDATINEVVLHEGSDITVSGKNSIETLIFPNGGIVGNNGRLTTNARFDNVTMGGTLTVGGSITVNGNLVLTDPIKNAGNFVLSSDSKVTVLLQGSYLSKDTVTLIENIETGKLDNQSELAENGIYDFRWKIDEYGKKTGVISVKTKSSEQIVSALKIDQQQAGTVAAILPTIMNSASAPASSPIAQIAKALGTSLELQDSQAVAQIAEDLAPSTAPVVSSVSQGVNNAIAGVANARMAANRAAGDVFTGGSAWAQVIYNSAEQDATKKTAKLESDTYGVTVGVDGKIGDNLTIGAGFGVTKTDAESGTRDIDVDSYALFGYTEYNADNGWFVNGMATAIRGRYEENKVPAGIKLTAKYQTTVLGAGVATGYHFENGLSPEVGLRYLRTHQGSYNDGAQKIHTDGTNLLTASIGAKYEKAFEQGDWVLKPSARVAATYDVVSDDTESAIRVIGGGQYHVISAHQKRAAYEAGIGLEASNGDWDFSVSYNGEFRSHFTSHTGMIKAKYNF